MSDEVWVLGATGRTGREIASRLHRAGAALVLVGRDRQRLAAVAAGLGDGVRTVAASLEDALARLAAEAPAVVVNTVGPFARTAGQVLDACPPGTGYLDLCNELVGARALLDRDAAARSANQTVVTGAGYGVTGTETVVQALCDGRPTPARVRVDSVASVATVPGRFGEALARSIVDGLADGGRSVRGGALVPARLGADAARLTTPDGDVVTTAGLPSGELVAAWRVSGAPDVVAASAAAPHGAAAAVVAVLAQALRVGPFRRFVTGRLAAVRLREKPAPRGQSWAHARVEWDDGTVREGWLGAGDGSAFTAGVATEVALRLLRDEVRPGAFTPAALFGPDLARAAGAQVVLTGGTPAA